MRKCRHPLFIFEYSILFCPEIQRDSEDRAAARDTQRKLRNSRRINVHASALSSREDGRRSSVDRDRLLQAHVLVQAQLQGSRKTR